MPHRETGKQRASRIALDYFKSADPLARAKRRLVALALIVSAGWCLSGLTLSRGRVSGTDVGRLRYSHGPLTRPHATWEARCDACHVPGAPSGGGTGWTRALGLEPKLADARCLACHDAPPHHDRQKADEVGSCATCHRDHQGREASLISRADRDCTTCHARLASHTIGGPPSYRDVKAFDRDHPDFRPLAAPDPGRLKFNHALHLAAGLNPVPGGRPLLTRDGRPVQLDCASCHRAEAGGTMAPVAFENQCVSCHRLEVPGPAGRPLAVRHRVQPADLRREVEDAFLARWLADDPARLGPGRPVPGARAAAERTARQAIARDVEKAEAVLYRGDKAVCAECHAFGPGEARRVVPPGVPAAWFPRARFDHGPHRAVDCLGCHAGAAKSATEADLLLPGIASCRQCHAPAGTAGGMVVGGAGHACTECHRYHPAAAAGRRAGMTLPQFLDGRPR